MVVYIYVATLRAYGVDPRRVGAASGQCSTTDRPVDCNTAWLELIGCQCWADAARHY